jgi:hypothetical protein
MSKNRWMTLVGAALVAGLWQAPAFAEDKPKEEPKAGEVKKEEKAAASKASKKEKKKESPTEEQPKAPH